MRRNVAQAMASVSCGADRPQSGVALDVLWPGSAAAPAQVEAIEWSFDDIPTRNLDEFMVLQRESDEFSLVEHLHADPTRALSLIRAAWNVTKYDTVN